MTQDELHIALNKLGLKVPEAERNDIFNVIKIIEEMRNSVRKTRSPSVEPSFTVSFPRLHNEF